MAEHTEVRLFIWRGSAEGRADMKELLGGKGANLAEMSVIGIPVPPGFTITTEVCADYYDRGRQLPEEVKPQVEAALARMEEAVGKKFGDPADPLLVSVRSGAALSMPGMMNTILNLGLTDASVEGLAKKTGNPRFAYDGYRRVIDMFGSTAMGVEHEAFEHELAQLKKERGVKLDTELDADDLKELVAPLQGRLQEARRRAVSRRTRRSSSGRRSWRSSIAGWATRPSSTAGSSGSPG